MARKIPLSFRPAIEELEGRLVPDAMIWNPVVGSTDGSDKNNWYDQTTQGNATRVPGSGDDVTFTGT